MIDINLNIPIDTTPTDGSTNLIDSNAVFDGLATKQETLVSTDNIKTINGNSVLGSGNLVVSGGNGIHALVKPRSGNSTTNMNATSTLGTLNVVTGRMYTATFIPNTTITTSSLYVNVINPIASSLAKILIYDNLDGQPNTLLYESTNLDCSTSGIKTATTSFTFNAGRTYWFCFWGNNTIGVSSIAIGNQSLIAFNGITVVTNYIQTVTYGLAPNPFGTTSNSNGAFPFIGATI